MNGFLNAEEIEYLRDRLYHADDDEYQTVQYSYRHAMTPGDDTVEHARWMANGFVKGQLMAAKRLFDKCKRKEAIYYLGLGMHAMQDSTLPAHHDFQKYYGGNGELMAHIYTELFDPGRGSHLDGASSMAYYYAVGSVQMLDDFFRGLGYDEYKK